MDLHDPVSALSHLFMAAWALLACIVLLRLASQHTIAQRLSLLFYSATVVSLYTASGLFHGLNHQSPEAKRVWQLLDQTAIFWLILGSNVPLLIYVLPGRIKYVLLTLMSGIAVAGTVSLWTLPRPPHGLLVFIYLAMGVLGLMPIRRYFARIGWAGMKWVILFASFYIAGGLFEAASWPEGYPGWFTYHEVLHLFDMAGTVTHYALLLRVVTMTPSRSALHTRRRQHVHSEYLLTPNENRTTH